jgi:hypothetical protein
MVPLTAIWLAVSNLGSSRYIGYTYYRYFTSRNIVEPAQPSVLKLFEVLLLLWLL